MGAAALGPTWRPPTAPAAGDHGPEWAGGRPQPAWQGAGECGPCPEAAGPPSVLVWEGPAPLLFRGLGPRWARPSPAVGAKTPAFPAGPSAEHRSGDPALPGLILWAGVHGAGCLGEAVLVVGVLREGGDPVLSGQRGPGGRHGLAQRRGAWTVGTAGGQACVEEQGPEHGHSSWGGILLPAACCTARWEI